jgi:hypothetical protein
MPFEGNGFCTDRESFEGLAGVAVVELTADCNEPSAIVKAAAEL